MRIKFSVIVLFVLIACCSLSLLTSFKAEQKNGSMSNEELLNKMFEATSNIKTLRYQLQCNERVKGKMHHTESFVKLQTSPRKIYLYLKGPEVLWVQGENNGLALVNPGAFPYVNLNLDPYGLIMRKDQHHTLHEMGMQYLADILRDGVNKVGADFDKHFVLLGDDTHNGHPCYKLSVAFPDFTWGTYVVKSNETVTSIARKLHVNEYLILEKNTKLKWYDDIKPGDVLQVPNVYAKLTILLIDKHTFVPLSTKIYDDKGLFETYEYYNLQVNTPIAPEEFTRTFKGYKF